MKSIIRNWNYVKEMLIEFMNKRKPFYKYIYVILFKFNKKVFLKDSISF